MNADLLLRGGPIFDVPFADAVAVRAGRITAVGRSADLDGLIGPNTALVELRGRPLLPGFVDAHVHLEAYARARQQLDLEGVRSISDIARLVAERAAGAPPGAWVLGRGWLRDHLERWPTAADLDPVGGNRPVALSSHDSHALWVNRAALRAAGIGRDTPDPPGGRIGRLSDGPDRGEPDGLLFETAQDPVYRVQQRPGPAERRAALAGVLAEAIRLGLVGAHDFEGSGTLAAFRALRADGALPLRVTMGTTRQALESDDWGELYGADEWLRVGLVKLYADGALGSRTAFMLEPYAGSSERGIPRLERAELAGLVRRARARGLGVAVHAIGDAAVRLVLDAFADARADDTPSARTQVLRIEHAQLVDPADQPRFAELGVIASMQPIHCTSDRPVAGQAWGARCATAYAWRSVLESGGRLAFGTDCPVEPLDPLGNLYVAVTRRDRAGRPLGGWYPKQRLSLAEAIRAYTFGPAVASGDAQRTGSISVGKQADLVVLSEPIFDRAPDALLRAGVDYTLVGGRILHRCFDE